jgi:hypothetical protein
MSAKLWPDRKYRFHWSTEIDNIIPKKSSTKIHKSKQLCIDQQKSKNNAVNSEKYIKKNVFFLMNSFVKLYIEVMKR